MRAKASAALFLEVIAVLLGSAGASPGGAPASEQGLPPDQAVGECLRSFSALEFSLINFDAYPNYFSNASYIELAQAGKFVGPDDIAEYVMYATPLSPYVEALYSFTQDVGFSGYNNATGECMFYIHDGFRATLSSLGDGAVIRFADLLKVFFSLESSTISAVHVFYSEEFLSAYFDLLDTTASAKFICGVMEESCPATWSFNNYASLEACMEDFASLPQVTPSNVSNTHFDGKSKGCRMVHSFLAQNNDKHCPHISFAPQEDYKGLAKCQESAMVEPAALFTEADLAAFEQFATSAGLPTGVDVQSRMSLADPPQDEAEPVGGVPGAPDGASLFPSNSESSSAPRPHVSSISLLVVVVAACTASRFVVG